MAPACPPAPPGTYTSAPVCDTLNSAAPVSTSDRYGSVAYYNDVAKAATVVEMPELPTFVETSVFTKRISALGLESL